MTKIVNTLLTLVVSSSVVLAQGWSGGPGKGIKYDGGDAFGLSISNQLQVHWTYMGGDVATDTSSFNVRRARTGLKGHAFNKAIRYSLLLDGVDDAAAGGGNIKDGHVTWDFMSDDSGSIGLRMGQGKTQFGLEGTGTSKGLFFVERSAAARAFSDARSTGAWVMGQHNNNQLRWSVGAMNGATASGLGVGYVDVGEEAGNSDHELSWAATAQFDPMGDTLNGGSREGFRQGDFRTDDTSLRGTVGVGVEIGNGRTAAGPGGVDVDSTAINVNTAWSINNFQVMGEFFMRTDETQGGSTDEEEPTGWALSGTYVMPKSGDSAIQWGFGAHINMSESDMGTNGVVNYMTVNSDVTEISLVANAFYHGHAAKTQLEYTMQDVDMGAADATNHILSIAFQLLF